MNDFNTARIRARPSAPFAALTSNNTEGQSSPWISREMIAPPKKPVAPVINKWLI
jgi:hypothetical protein